jgi:hypothetical protein
VQLGAGGDFAALAAQAAAKKAERERMEAALEAERKRMAEEEARRQAVLAAERKRLAAEEAALQAQLEAERKRRIAAARDDLLKKAEADLQPLLPLLRGPMSSATKTALQTYLRRYRAARITVEGSTESVTIPGVARIDRALAAEAAREKAALAADRQRRIEDAKEKLLAQAAQDFVAIQPLLADTPTEETRPVLEAFLTRYGSAKITVDREVEKVTVPGVDQVQRALGRRQPAGPFYSDDPEGIKSVVRKKKSQVQYCYEQSLKAQSVTGSALDVQMKIFAGRVISAKIVQNTTGDSNIESCVVGKVRRWRFPPGVTASFVMPFVFEFGISKLGGLQEAVATSRDVVPKFDPSILNDTFASLGGAIRRCTKGRHQDGYQPVRVQVRFTLLPSGNVQNVAVKYGSGRRYTQNKDATYKLSASSRACVSRVIISTQFPAFEGKATEVARVYAI